MNFYEKKLKEKREYQHVVPEDKTVSLKKTKVHKLKHTKKNAQLGMF